ncbi:MAG: hypothetical protein EA396_15145 [Anaerolineaceae bacterium]|nr:MAG: hypothetical protein EA396_15145 [Anaerolineaceae bacterium]
MMTYRLQTDDMQNLKLMWRALILTLRGEKVRRPYGKLIDWIERGAVLANQAIKQADAAGLDTTARRKLTAKIDGREQSLETVLEAIRYHADTEYPYMMEHLAEHTITAIYATNMNDQYALARLLEAHRIQPAQTHRALQALDAHLQAIPPSNDLAN